MDGENNIPWRLALIGKASTSTVLLLAERRSFFILVRNHQVVAGSSNVTLNQLGISTCKNGFHGGARPLLGMDAKASVGQRHGESY